MFEQSHPLNGALNAKVLLLNQSYEPLTVCNVKKAIILMVLGKAEVVEKKLDRKVRSVSRSLPWPSVIRLNSFIHVPYKKIILSRKNVLKRDHHKCAYCGRSDLPLTLDHILPKSRGGADAWENLVAACTKCNNKKGNHTPKEAGMRLTVTPYTPNHIMFMRNMVSRLDEKWKPFLFQHQPA